MLVSWMWNTAPSKSPWGIKAFRGIYFTLNPLRLFGKAEYHGPPVKHHALALQHIILLRSDLLHQGSEFRIAPLPLRGEPEAAPERAEHRQRDHERQDKLQEEIQHERRSFIPAAAHWQSHPHIPSYPWCMPLPGPRRGRDRMN